jgi:hypothetical protein
MVWPGERLVCELDPRGADLPYRMKNTAPHELIEGPSLAALAIDARLESDRRPLPMYAQETTVGVPLIVGEPSCERFSRLLPHLPAIGTTFADWAGTVIADLGCLQPWNPAVPLAGLASVVLLVSRADTESLGHLRDRVQELAGQFSGTQRAVGIAVRAPRTETRQAVRRVERLLASVGSPVSVVGPLPEDPAAAAALWSGALMGRFMRSELFKSARDLAERLCGTWSEPTPAVEPSDSAGWIP